ncbi:MAG: ion channel [Verrucomicrobiota bacterium]
MATITKVKMNRRSLSTMIGLAGVSESETPRARRWGVYFEVPMLILAIWIVAEGYLTTRGTYPDEWAAVTNWVIWCFFVVETLLLSILVRDTKFYLRTNWMNLVIIAVGIPLLWHDQPYAGALRALRILLLFGILVEMSTTTRAMLRRNHVGLTLFVAGITVILAGTMMAAIDPAIETPWDGIWWAWVTVTTVGYGDIVPASPQGKVFGGFLMVFGLGLFSLITASFSAFLISREEEGLIEQEKEVVSEEQRTLANLERIEQRLEKLERNLSRLVEDLPKERSKKEEDMEENSSSPG